jgi:hypothetical protein
MYSFGSSYIDCIKTLLHSSCVAMGDDKQGITFRDLLDDKLDYIKPAVDEFFREKVARNEILAKTIEEKGTHKAESTGDEIVDMFNAHYFSAWDAGHTACVYWKETHEAVHPIDGQSLSIATSELVKVYPDGKSQPALRHWLKHPKRRQYERVQFSPMQTLPEDQYNLFKGYKVRPKEGNWEHFREFWVNVICAGDDEIFRYTFAWVAQLFQRPFELSGTALILFSKAHGTGKGTFAHALGRLLGHGLYVSDCGIDNVFGRFNGHLERALLINIDESEGSLTRRQRDAIKHAITEPYKACEHKGLGRYQVRNYTRYILTTNNKDSAHIDASDRRQVVVNPSSHQVGNKVYFDAIYHELAHGGLEALLYDLLEYDLVNSGVDLRKIPDTKARQEMRASSLSEVTLFWRSYLILSGSTTVHMSQAHSDYLEGKPRWASSLLQFTSEIKELCPSAKEIIISTIGNTRKMVLELNSIEQARQDFERQTNTVVDWMGDAVMSKEWTN